MKVMRTNLAAFLTAAAVALAPVAASAQGANSTITGAAGGAITGAIVGGPVGAAVGGVIGAIVGTAIDPPDPAVVTYVATQSVPPVVVEGQLVVGATLPATVPLYMVPADVYPAANGQLYAYATVNGQRVIVDPNTRVVVAITG
jgi:hypothetical protein